MVNVIERNTCRGERSVIHYQGPRDGQSEGYDECIGQSDPQFYLLPESINNQ